MFHIEFKENGQYHKTRIIFRTHQQAKLYAEENLKTEYIIYETGDTDVKKRMG
tara:strand:+ start:442 stop:600 length:159 start_codon:yes stop_codon:yes gene_type:complete